MDKILIIDDSMVQARMLAQLLCDEYMIEVCHESVAGLEKATSWTPSLILLDVIMPVMDGFQVLTQLKESESTKHIPVILITSLSDIGNEENGLRMGAVDYITKPFNECIVKARIHTHIQLYNYRRMIESLAMMDALTGIPNRRAYDEQIQAEWIRAQKNRAPLSIAMVDIDYFKQYNDTYGHPAGDDALKQVASIISHSLREYAGFAARYGGEEFIMLMPDTPSLEGFRICDSIRSDIEQLCIPHAAGKPPGYLTVSIGGTTAMPGGQNFYEDYVSLADHVLYQAKGSGKNKVSWYCDSGQSR